MTKVEIVALAEHWQAKADRAMDRYQESGLARNVISTARLYGVDSALPTSRKRADKEVRDHD